MSTFISTRELAQIAGVTHSALRKALTAIETGERTTWRGAALVIRHVRGRGGRAGRLNEVRTDSLPAPIQALLNGSERPFQLSLKLDAPADAEVAWKEAFLRPATRTEKGTPERRDAIRQLATIEQVRDGRRIKVPERTIQRWMADFDAHGLGGLRRRKRSDAGKQAVLITRRWDAATTQLSDGVRKRIAAQLAQHRRNLWGNGTSYIDVKRLASEFLADATADAGIVLPEADLRAVCELPKHVVEIDRDKRDVHEFRTDRKSWDDKRPRMKLTSAGLRPMQVVYGDVHHFDIYLERDDGSLATPKAIAWLDAATGRIRIDIKLCAPGTAVRNADLIDSFIGMTQDPYWGMPEALYLDNVLCREGDGLFGQQVSDREFAPAA